MTMRVRVSGYFILGFSIVAFLAVGFVIVGFYVAVNCTPYMQDTFAMLKRKQNSLIQIRVITVPFCNYGPVLCCFRDKARYCRKSQLFSYPFYIAEPWGKQ